MTSTIGLIWFAAIIALAEFRLPVDVSAAIRALDAGLANILPVFTLDGGFAFLETLVKIGWGIVVAVAAQGACLAVGGRVGGWLGGFARPERSEGMTGRGIPVDRLTGWLLGLGIVGLALFGLGLAGLYDRVTLGCVAVVLLGPVGGWRALRQLTVPAAPAGDVLARWARGAALLSLGFTAVTLACPETGVDSLIHHLAVPARALHHHKISPMVHNFLYTVPALSEMLRGWTLALGGDPAARLWGAAALVAGGVALANIVRPVAGLTWSWIAAALWITSPWLAELARAGKPDLWIAPLALAAFARLDRGGRRSGLIAGVLGGVAAGIKPAAAGVFAVIVPAFVFTRRLRLAVLGWAVVGAGAALTAWAVRAALLTGDPLYPFGHGRSGMTSEAVAALVEYYWRVAVRGHYATWGERLASPWTATLTDGLPAFWLAVTPLALLATRPGDVARRLAFVGVLGWAVWLVGPPQLRYAMPALAWLAAAALLGLAAAAAVRPRMAGAAVGILLVLQTVRSAVSAAASGALLAGVGLEEHGAYTSRTLGVYAEMTGRLSATVPRQAKVLYIGERRGYPVAYRTLVASIAEPFPLLPLIRSSATPEELQHRIRQLGVTRIVHNHLGALFSRELQTMEGWTARDLGVWAEYWRRHARVLSLPDRLDLHEGGYYIYRIAAERETPLPTPTLPGIEGVFASIEGRMRRGELQGVAEQAAVLDQIAGDFAEVKYFLGKMWYAQDPYQAAAFLKRADAEEYRHLDLWSALARRAEDQWRLDEALKWHRKILASEPRAAGADYRRVLGKLIGGARKRHRPADAERFIRMALDITPADASLWSELSEMLLWLDRRGESMDAIREAIRLNPRHPGYRGTLGHLLRAS